MNSDGGGTNSLVSIAAGGRVVGEEVFVSFRVLLPVLLPSLGAEADLVGLAEKAAGGTVPSMSIPSFAADCRYKRSKPSYSRLSARDLWWFDVQVSVHQHK